MECLGREFSAPEGNPKNRTCSARSGRYGSGASCGRGTWYSLQCILASVWQRRRGHQARKPAEGAGWGLHLDSALPFIRPSVIPTGFRDV
jgi:hypothetical protein